MLVFLRASYPRLKISTLFSWSLWILRVDNTALLIAVSSWLSGNLILDRRIMCAGSTVMCARMAQN